MLRPQGYATVVGEGVLERDTVTCGHCNSVIFVKPGTVSTVYITYHRFSPPTEEPGAGCRLCGSAICLTCYADGRCLPVEKRIAHAEKTGQWLV